MVNASRKRMMHIDIPVKLHARLMAQKQEFEPLHNVIKRLLDNMEETASSRAEGKVSSL